MPNREALKVKGEFGELVKNRHEYAREWKTRTGGKVVGYMCSYVPEELLAAAGVLPVRVLGGHEPQDLSASYMCNMFCAYSRDVLGQGLLGRYSYLDGLVLAHCCTHIRQSFESWRRHMPTEFDFLLWVPTHVKNPHALGYFNANVAEFKESVEKWLDTTISPEQLRSAIETYNMNRRLLQQVQELRKQDPPLISGADAMEIVLASLVMDKKENNQLLQEFLAQPPQTPVPGVRLMALGSENDDVGLIRLIESLDAVIVVEDNCIGNRYFSEQVKLDGHLVSSIAARYLDKPPCPWRDEEERWRVDYLLELAKEYNVAGVVFLRQKFCDAHVWEIPVVQKRLQQEGLPTLALELDISTPYGQYRTRVEAFLETFII